MSFNDNLQLLNSRDIEGRFYELLETRETPMWVDNISWRVDTMKEEEIYRFLGFGPRMTEFQGRREAEKPPAAEIRVRNKIFSASMFFGKDERRRDLTGQIDIRVNELADEPNNHLEEYFTSAIENGGVTSSEFGAAYDTKAFFANDHEWEDSGTQDNLLGFAAATGTAPTAAEFKTLVMQAIQAMKGFKDNKGRPINRGMRAVEVVIPTVMWSAALEAFSSDVLYDGSAPVTNTLKAVQSAGTSITLVENAWATSDVNVYTFRTDGRLAPFIWQTEVEPEISSLDESSDHYHDHRETVHTVEGIYGLGYGRWEYATKTVVT